MEAPSPLLRKGWDPARRGSQVVYSWRLLASDMIRMRRRTIKSALHDLLCIYISALGESDFNKDLSKTSLFNRGCYTYFFHLSCLLKPSSCKYFGPSWTLKGRSAGLSSLKLPWGQLFLPCALDSPVSRCAPMTRWLHFTANEMLY